MGVNDSLNDSERRTSSQINLLADDDPRQSAVYYVVEDWFEFSKGAFNHSYLFMGRLFMATLISSMTLAPSMLGRQLVNTSGFVLFNIINDTTSQAAFGVFDSLYFVFFVGLITTLVDKYGIGLSSAYGERKYNNCKVVMTKGLLTCFIYFCLVTMPVMLFCKPVLVSVGIEEEVAEIVQNTCWLAIPLMVVNMVSEQIKTFCMSQGHESLFGYTSIVNLVLTIGANYFVIVKYDWGVPGWVLTKTINEVITLLISIYVLYQTHPETRGLSSWTEVKDQYLSFFWDSTLFVLGVYPEFIGFELVALFIATAGDTNQVAAYYCVCNIASILYNGGSTFAIIGRTRVNILLGMKKYSTARNAFRFLLACNAIFGGLMALIVVAFKDWLESVYSSSNPEVEQWFLLLLMAYLIGCPSEMCINMTFLGMKSVGKIRLLLFITILIPLCGSFVGCWLLTKMGYNGFVIFGFYMILVVVLNIVSLVCCLNSNWNLNIVDNQKSENKWAIVLDDTIENSKSSILA